MPFPNLLESEFFAAHHGPKVNFTTSTVSLGPGWYLHCLTARAKGVCEERVAAQDLYFFDGAIAFHQHRHLRDSSQLHSRCDLGVVRDNGALDPPYPFNWDVCACGAGGSVFGRPVVGRFVASLAEGKNFRAETYVRTVQRFGVDFKVDASMFPDEIDHAALPQKGVVLTHEKQAGLRQSLDIGQSALSSR